MTTNRRELLSGLALTMLYGLRAEALQGGLKSALGAIQEIAASETGVYVTTDLALWFIVDERVFQLIQSTGLRLPIARGTVLYCVDSAGRVLGADRNTAAAKIIADAHRSVHHMVLDDAHVYVACRDTRRSLEGGAPDAQPGVVLRAPLAGGPFEKLAEHQSALPSLAVDADRVYLSTDDGIAFVEKRGGALRTLVATNDANQRPAAMIAHEHRLYTLTQNQLREIDPTSGSTRTLHDAPLLLDLVARGEWIYVVRGSVAGKPPRPGALLAVSTKSGAVKSLDESLHFPQKVALGKDSAWVLESALYASKPGPAQLKRVRLAA